jgi:hypothetical protein
VIESLHITYRLLATAREFKITNDRFDIIDIHDWPDIFKKIEAKFIVKKNTNTRFNWWWDNLKSDRFSLIFPNDDAWKYLHLFIDENEKVWFVACDSDRNPSKFWLFEGFIEPIQQIIGALNFFEYYVVSKKYDWFLAENHHGMLIGLGAVKSKMLEFKENIR